MLREAASIVCALTFTTCNAWSLLVHIHDMFMVQVEGNVKDVNGWCDNVLQESLPGASRGLNASRVAKVAPYCKHLQATAVTSPSDIDGEWANAGTVFYAPEQRVSNRCPVILNTSVSEFAWIPGCSGKEAFGLNQWQGDVCQGVNLFTTPLIESRVHTGALESTYVDAWRVFVDVWQLPSEQRQRWFIGGSRDPGYFMLADASGQCNTSRVVELQLRELRQVEDIVREAVIVDKAEGAIILGFTQLFIATVTIIMMWGPTTQEAASAFIEMFLTRVQHCCRPGTGSPTPNPRARMALLVLLRFISAVAVFGPALFGFITVTAQGTGTTFVEGYPTLRFLEVGYAACSNARIGSPALGVTRVATTRIDVQTWAVCHRRHCTCWCYPFHDIYNCQA